jgi:hypothetical protein
VSRLSVQARLALDVDRATRRAESLRWQNAAGALEANSRWWSALTFDDDVD